MRALKGFGEKSEEKIAQALARLEQQLARTSVRTAWRRDFDQTVAAHRDLAQGFARALAAL